MAGSGHVVQVFRRAVLASGGIGAAVRRLLDDPGQASQMGRAAHAHIREQYLGDLHLLRYAGLFSALLPGG